MHGQIACAGPTGATIDPRFAEDEFTRQAVQERTSQVTHAHAKGLAVTVLGTVAFLGLARAFVRAVR